VEPGIIKSWDNLNYLDFTNCTQLSSLFQRNTGLVEKNVIESFFALLALVKKSRIGTYFTIFDDAKTLILLKLSCNENRNGQYIPKYSAAAHFFSKENVNLAAVSMFASI